MDLIYTDLNRLDIGVLKDYELDFEIGTENDFQITTSIDNNVIPMVLYKSATKVNEKAQRFYFFAYFFVALRLLGLTDFERI